MNNTEPIKEVHFLNYENFTLPYLRYGSGSELLFAFHGFGQSAKEFSVFEDSLGSVYTIIAFDFFYHGINDFEKQIGIFTPSILSNMLEQFMWTEKKVRCSVIGYSMGAKLVLGIVHRLPHRLKEIFLIAPDGFTNDYLPRFTGGTVIGRLIGKYTVNHPEIFFSLIGFAKKCGFISEKKAKFFSANVETHEQRLRILNTWITLKKYSSHIDLARHYIRTRKIRFEVFLGKEDKIIPAVLIRKFFRGLRGKGTLFMMDCGHNAFQQREFISREIMKSQ